MYTDGSKGNVKNIVIVLYKQPEQYCVTVIWNTCTVIVTLYGEEVQLNQFSYCGEICL